MSAGLDRLAELAREDAPAPLAPAEAARLVETAVRAAGARRRPARRRRVAGAVAGALAIAALAAAWILVGRTPAPRAVQVAAAPAAGLRFELPSGDRVSGAAGAELRVRSAEPSLRRIELAGGSALFDVAPLGHGARFEVATAHARVEVVGTVFTVTSTPEHTIVRVYEGHVRVVVGERRIDLEAGETWASDGPPGGADPLFGEARAAADRRAAAAPQVTALEAEPAPPATPAVPARRSPARAADAEPDADLADVRGWISLGEAAAERARATAHVRGGGRWRVVEADALRALHRHDEAAAAYDAALPILPAGEAAQAAYLAAFLHFDRRHDAAAALASLDAGAADAPGAPLEERALALRATAFAALGRTAEAAAAAARYLDRFPEGSQATAMASLAAAR